MNCGDAFAQVYKTAGHLFKDKNQVEGMKNWSTVKQSFPNLDKTPCPSWISLPLKASLHAIQKVLIMQNTKEYSPTVDLVTGFLKVLINSPNVKMPEHRIPHILSLISESKVLGDVSSLKNAIENKKIAPDVVLGRLTLLYIYLTFLHHEIKVKGDIEAPIALKTLSDREIMRNFVLETDSHPPVLTEIVLLNLIGSVNSSPTKNLHLRT